jgi:predicted TPR repeat methyltransferase
VTDDQDPIPAARELTIDEAVSLAIGCQQRAQLTEAAAIYDALLEMAPDHPLVLHYAGVLAHQQGRTGDAIRLIERSLTLDSGRADWHCNLGKVFRDTGRIDDAIAAYERALALDSAHANTHNNLGVLLRSTGKAAEAEASYRKAIAIDPTHIEAHHNLGNLLVARRRAKEAVVCYDHVLALNPTHREARRLLALACCSIGAFDKAAAIYRQWLEEDPSDPVARYMLAACSGQGVPARAPDDYVERVFDNFAPSFDQKLARLSYRAPQLVAALLTDAGVPAAGALDILDAGCGTGLCGPLLAPFAGRLIGVDLSQGMLTKAATRRVYHELVKGELTDYLRRSINRFDAIASADTLIYFGGLDEVIQAAAAALRPGGWLVFTLEEAPAGASTKDYTIAHHGRFQHAREYVERVLTDARLEWYIVCAELRMESGLPVAGFAVRALKPYGDRHA